MSREAPRPTRYRGERRTSKLTSHRPRAVPFNLYRLCDAPTR
jgi:hypothetical protein